MTARLADRMRQAADTLEEVSSLFGYPVPSMADWSAADLRCEAEHVGNETPA